MLSALTNAIHAYFPTSEATPGRREQTNSKDRLKHLHNRKRQLRKEWRARRREPLQNTEALRAEFHAVHRRIKWLSSHVSNVVKEATKRKNTKGFRADPFTFGKRLFKLSNTARPDFSLEDAYSTSQKRTQMWTVPPATLTFLMPQMYQQKRCLSRCPFRRLKTSKHMYVELEIALHLAQTAFHIPSGSTVHPYSTACIPLSGKYGNQPRYQHHGAKPALSFFTKREKHQSRPTSDQSLYPTAMVSSSFRSCRRNLQHSWFLIATLTTRHKMAFCQVCQAVLNIRRSHKKHFATPAKIIVQPVLRGLIFAMLLAVFGICLCSSACRGTTFRLTSVDWFSTTTNNLPYTQRSPLGKRWRQLFRLPNWGFSRLCPFTGPIQHLFSATSGLSAPQGNLQWMELQLQVQPSVLRDTSACADNLEICSWSVTCGQAQLDLTNSYFLWSRSLQARPDKCFAATLGFDKAGHFGPINPNLSIGGTKINNLGDADFKYLGKYLNMRSSKVNCRKLTMETLESLL